MSIDYGMFIVQPNYEAMQQEAQKQMAAGVQTRTCGEKTETRQCQPNVTC